MGIYKTTDVTMVLDGLDLIRHGKVAAAPLQQESEGINLPALGDSFSDIRPGPPSVSIAFDAWADDGTYSILDRIKDQVDSDSVPLSYGVRGTGQGKRVYYLPAVGINGYSVTPTLNDYVRVNATFTGDSDTYYPHGIIVQDWTTVAAKGSNAAPSATDVDGQDSEPDNEHAVYGVDIENDGTDDYLVFGSAAGATVPVTVAGDKWLIYVGSGTATWTDATVTLAASNTGRAEITAGLTASQATAFDAAQAAGATMAAKPIETNSGGSAVCYVESAEFGERVSLSFRLWHRADATGAWTQAIGGSGGDRILSTAAHPTSARLSTQGALQRYVAVTHNMGGGTSGSDAVASVRYRCEFIRHMPTVQI